MTPEYLAKLRNRAEHGVCIAEDVLDLLSYVAELERRVLEIEARYAVPQAEQTDVLDGNRWCLFARQHDLDSETFFGSTTWGSETHAIAHLKNFLDMLKTRGYAPDLVCVQKKGEYTGRIIWEKEIR